MQRIFFRPVTFSWLLDLLCLVSNSNKFQLLKYSLKNLFKKKKKILMEYTNYLKSNTSEKMSMTG